VRSKPRVDMVQFVLWKHPFSAGSKLQEHKTTWTNNVNAIFAASVKITQKRSAE